MLQHRAKSKRGGGADTLPTIEGIRSLSPASSGEAARETLCERSVHRVRRGHAAAVSIRHAIAIICVAIRGCCRREVAAERSYPAEAVSSNAVPTNAVAADAVSAKRDFFGAKSRHVVGVAPRPAPSAMPNSQQQNKTNKRGNATHDRAREGKKKRGKKTFDTKKKKIHIDYTFQIRQL